MHPLTIADVWSVDPEAFRAAALRWESLAADLDGTCETLRAGRVRLDAAGHAATLTAATGRIRGHERALSLAIDPARRIARALLAHADGLAAVQRHLDAMLASMPVTGPTVNGRSGAVMEVLTQARRLDTATATAIASSLPAPDRDGADGAPGGDGLALGRRAGRVPAEVLAWWQGLPAPLRERALREHPGVIGGLDGIPAADRDQANRRYLDELVASPAPPAGLLAVRDRLAATPEAYLLLVDGSGDGRVAVALGDPDQARHTALFVPGVAADLLDIHGEVARAAQLRRVADQTTVEIGDVSVVYWLGYDPPDGVLDGWREDPARQGGVALTRFVDGLRATHRPDLAASHVTVVGYSYGSTVVAEGARAGGLPVDDIVVVGSPGLHSDHARELNLDPRHVWVGRSASDEIRFVPEPIHGREPADPAYGANRFTTDTTGHSGYWRPGSDSLLNQAYVITGQYDRVMLVHGERPA